jgi:hypothetical protein
MVPVPLRGLAVMLAGSHGLQPLRGLGVAGNVCRVFDVRLQPLLSDNSAGATTHEGPSLTLLLQRQCDF